MRGLALCSGLCGIELGLRLARDDYRTVAYCEREPFAVDITRRRIADGWLDDGPIFDDVVTFPADEWAGRVDIISAGFPCQPWSVAGKRRGKDDERWLWPAIVDIVRVVGPRYVFLENVSGLISGGGMGSVLGDLAALGFDAEWDCFRASDVGAPHRRERVFILGVAQGNAEDEPGGVSRDVADPAISGRRAGIGNDDARESDAVGSGTESADASSERGQRLSAERRLDGVNSDGRSTVIALWPPSPSDADAWRIVLESAPEYAPATEPVVRRLADGLPKRVGEPRASRVNQLRALGNAVVPVVAAKAFLTLSDRIDCFHLPR